MGRDTIGGQGMGSEKLPSQRRADAYAKFLSDNQVLESGFHNRGLFYAGWDAGSKEEGIRLPNEYDWVTSDQQVYVTQTWQESNPGALTIFRLGWQACLEEVKRLNQVEEIKIEPEKPNRFEPGRFPFATVWNGGNDGHFDTFDAYQASLANWRLHNTPEWTKHFWGYMWNPVAEDWVLIQEEHWEQPIVEERKPAVLDLSRVFEGQVYATVWEGGRRPLSQGFDAVTDLDADIKNFHYSRNSHDSSSLFIHDRLSIFVKVKGNWELVEEQFKMVQD